jgi:hypothetical protein
MKHALSRQSTFATLFDPEVARAVAERATHWNLPRHMCHPLERHVTTTVSADLAAYDAAVDRGPAVEEELPGVSLYAGESQASAPDEESDAEDF